MSKRAFNDLLKQMRKAPPARGGQAKPVKRKHRLMPGETPEPYKASQATVLEPPGSHEA